jgi:hypothetical protein
MGNRLVALALVWATGYLAAGAERPGPKTPAIDLTQGLIAHYPFDKDASDASGKGRHATHHGATPVAGGKLGGAFSFDGSNDHVAVPAAATQGLIRFTIALWLKTEQADAKPRKSFWQNPTLVGCATPGRASGDLALMLEGGRAAYFHGLFVGGSDMSWFSASRVSDGKWHHVALVNGGPRILLYVDGRLTRGEGFSTRSDSAATRGMLSQTASGLSLGAAGLFIGASNDTHPPKAARHFYRGFIDDVWIWKRALTAREVAALCARALRQ